MRFAAIFVVAFFCMMTGCGPPSTVTPSPGSTGTNVYTVTLGTDSNPTSVLLGVGSGVGMQGDLRFGMAHAQPNTAIQFDVKQIARNNPALCSNNACTITLSGPLPIIETNLAIDGASFGRITIDGSGKYRAFFADSGTIVIKHLQIQNVTAKGGDGGYPWGGGGAGLGAGIFVNQATASVSVSDDFFVNCQAVGGTGAGGGNPGDPSFGGGGGGGGLGGNGGGGPLSGPSDLGGSGGGGLLQAGDTATTSGGAFGGSGYGPTAGSGGTAPSGNGANGGSGGGGGGGGGGGINVDGSGGTGGFGGGGGGGGAALANIPTGFGGAGGFGGGGGGGGEGGNGGPGGGGATGYSNGGGQGGGALATISGGSGKTTNSNGSGGGGGAAAGPAIFVNAGSVQTTSSGASQCLATGGTAPYLTPATPGGSDSTPVFNYAGIVNGSTTAGPVPAALGTSAPMALLRH